jgi:hypothetical protein
MKTITYAGESFVTGDEIALAVLEYARALARSGTADTVDIPVRNAAGDVVVATLLIGPASQIVAEDGEDSGDELRDDEVVAELSRRTRATESPAAAVEDTQGLGLLLSEFDLDDRPDRQAPSHNEPTDSR